MKREKYFAIAAVLLFVLCNRAVSAESKQTVYNSPYVTFSPDKKAWTANAGDKKYTWYEAGTAVNTNIASSLRAPKTGEHHYLMARRGEVPVGQWRVTYRGAQCIHNDYPPGFRDYHGIPYKTSACRRYYYSGWGAFCADCGEPITNMLIYMSKEAAETIDYIDLGKDGSVYNEYYYLCPHCNNLEQGAPLLPHVCKAVSKNQYKVHYEANTGGEIYGGYMSDSLHMYENASVYEGLNITPVTKLTKNAFTRVGYEFIGWNTRPDGTGTAYADRADIYNLSTADYNCRETWSKEDKGVVTLYAMWRPGKGTLIIDAAGGLYQGNPVLWVTGEYLGAYRVDNTRVKPPAGYRVSFETNGGGRVAPVQGTMQLAGWSINKEYRGKWENNVYTFLGTDGSKDTLTASYVHDLVTLPAASKPGSSFGGWYYDREWKEAAGGPGDTIVPDKNLTLYAQWVELTLEAKDNYRVNGGRGAVDLSWSQPDGSNKTYLIYQSTNGVNWNQVSSAEDIGNGFSVAETYGFSGRVKSFITPYAGLYTLSAQGAQGGRFGNYAGGRGGEVSARVWLEKGEVVSCHIGGSNGYNGGGSGNMFAGGGGCTVVSTDKKGTVLIAGGGGGATSMGNGNPGGSLASVTGNKNLNGAAGQNGGAGGGGGYQGGSAGELVVHHHSDACYYTEDLSYLYQNGVINSIKGWGLTNARKFVGNGKELWKQEMTSDCLIPTNGNTTLEIHWKGGAWGEKIHTVNLALEVYNSRKEKIYYYSLNATGEENNWSPGGSFVKPDGSWGGTPDSFDMDRKLTVDVSGTDGIWIAYSIWTTYNEGGIPSWIVAHYNSTVNSVYLKGGVNKRIICGYTQGQILSSRPAYGGSNYVNTAYAYSYTDRAGVRNGDGGFSVVSESIGYLETLGLNGVISADLAAPDKVPGESQYLQCQAISKNQVQITWQKPADRGTVYYHRAQSYLRGSTALLCTSNVTKNTLTSGIKGYYYLVDTSPVTAVTAANGNLTRNRSVLVTTKEQAQYLHLAPVDVAGNVGGTTHVKIDAAKVRWKLFTEQLSIIEGGNVHPANEVKTWYVKADGSTPFTLEHSAYLDGKATADYQPNHTIFETFVQEEKARSRLFTPSFAISAQEIRTDAEGLFYETEGRLPMGQYPYFYTLRSDSGRKLKSVQRFLLDKSYSGKRIRVTPIAGADYEEEIIYSDYSADSKNSITLIGDGEPPVLAGLEMLKDRELIDRRDGPIFLNISASDALSGVGSFYVKVYNQDNTVEKVYRPGENGSILMEITEDEPVFSGDFTVTAWAGDNVGNYREETFQVTEFALDTKVERILSPHEPVFKSGESGILTITTWGYADRVEVEFPEEMVRLNPELNKIYEYSQIPDYKQEETLQFMVPLYTPINSRFVITVRAYKGDKKLEEYPSLSVIAVGESVLEDFRTRLR